MNPVYSLSDVNTACPSAVADAITQILSELYPHSGAGHVSTLIQETRRLFQGEIPPYQANDLAYHDLEHTLQVSLCWVRMLYNFNLHDDRGPATWEDVLIGIAGTLLHDTGYLKKHDDANGTGAKYTFIHESRGCRIAEDFLGKLKWDPQSVASVQRLIAATGPRAVVEAIPFISLKEERLAQMVATADFLAQMSDPQYLDKLPSLYAEFEESDQFRGLDVKDRPFPDLKTLISQTPVFWEKFVKPRLRTEYSGVFHYLNHPYPDGPNPYIQQAEVNIAHIKEEKSP